MSTGLQIVLLFLLVAWTAFFVAAEYAFVASRPTRMRELAEQGSKRAARVAAIAATGTPIGCVVACPGAAFAGLRMATVRHANRAKLRARCAFRRPTMGERMATFSAQGGQRG